MNILFLTMNVFTDITTHGIYTDLMNEFIKNGHRPYIVTPREKRLDEKTELVDYGDYIVLKVQIGNTSNVSLIEKGISTITLSYKYYKSVINELGHIKFDLILYSTPPITLAGPVIKLKRHFGCRTYLMLKDIFPQNAVDLGMFSSKSIIYKYFRHQEKKLYMISDRIGCMSPANVKYLLENNSDIDSSKVEICPNSVEPIDMSVDVETRIAIREKYGIPVEKKVFVYGGNLGRPQGIDFLIKCLDSQKENEETYFLIVGDGTEFGKLEAYVESSKQKNLKLMKRLPKEDYDIMVGACDVGMIFLDHRFTIPNFPSRLLSYMQAKVPVLAVTDLNTDIGKVIVDGGFGWWCESNDVGAFSSIVECIKDDNICKMQNKEFEFLKKFYSAEQSYETIMKL